MSGYDPGGGGGVGRTPSRPTRRHRGDTSFYANGRAKKVGIRWPAGEYAGWMWLNVNPQSFSLQMPTRLSITQGMTGAFVDSLGFGLPSGRLAGTCGFGLPLDDPEQGITGLEQIRQLKRSYEAWQDYSARYTEASGYPCEIMVGPTCDQHYTVIWEPSGLRLSHDSAKPFLIYYDLAFRVVYDWQWQTTEGGRPAPLRGTGAPAPTDGSTPTSEH